MLRQIGGKRPALAPLARGPLARHHPPPKQPNPPANPGSHEV